MSLSIGDIAIAPTDANILYVGTGEPNCGGGSLTYPGVGVYKSTDAGTHWTHIDWIARCSSAELLLHRAMQMYSMLQQWVRYSERMNNGNFKAQQEELRGKKFYTFPIPPDVLILSFIQHNRTSYMRQCGNAHDDPTAEHTEA